MNIRNKKKLYKQFAGVLAGQCAFTDDYREYWSSAIKEEKNTTPTNGQGI